MGNKSPPTTRIQRKMRPTLSIAIAITTLTVPSHGAIFITGILDGTLSGATPRAFELYTTDAIANFEATYQFQYAANTNAYTNTTTSFGAIPAASYFYVTNSATTLNSVFGPGLITHQNGGITPTGNDSGRIQLKSDSSVIDEAYTNTSSTNVYQDSYMYRLDGTGPDSTYNAANWTFGGNNLLDGKTEAEIGAMVPLGTFAIPEPSAVGLIGLASLMTLARRRRR
jgi:hypothetical protein